MSGDALLESARRPLDPQTNLPEERTGLENAISMRVPSARAMAPSSVQIGAYGLEGRRIGQSQYDTNVLPQDILYGHDLEAIRSANQPGWHMLGNALVQMGAEVVGGTIEGFGYLGDLGAWGNMIQDREYDFGNAFSEMGTKIKEKSKESNPVYRSFEPGDFDPGNWSWWMNNASSVASSLSLLVPSYAAMKGLSYLGKGTKVLSTMQKTAKAAGIGEESFKMISKGVTRAVASRHAENMMESSQLYNQIYQENLSKDMDEEEARANASKAASQVYKRNWAMILQDVPQYMLLGSRGVLPRASAKNTIASAKAMGKKTMPIHAKNALKYGNDVLGEGAEEGYQFIVQKEGEYTARMALNPDEDPTTFGSRMQEYIEDGEMHTAMFMGAIGAGAMHVGTRATDKVMRTMRDKYEESQTPADGEVKAKAKVDPRVADIGGFGAMASRMYKNIMRAYESGNQDWIDQANDEGAVDMAMQSALHENIDNLVEFYEAASNPTPEDIERWPQLTPELVEQMKTKRTELIQEARKYEKKYNQNLKKVDKGDLKSPQDAALLTRQELLLDKLNGRVSEVKARANEARKNIPRFNELSDPQRNIHGLTFEIDAVDKQLAWTDKLIKERDDISKEEKKPIKESAKRLREISKELKAKRKAEEEKLTPEMKASDKTKGIVPKMFTEWKEALAAETAIEANIAEVKDTIGRIWRGELNKRKTESKDAGHEEKLDSILGVPTEDDIVKHTNQADGEVITGKVIGIDSEKPDLYTIGLLDESGKPLLVNGVQITKNVDVANLEIDVRSSNAYNQSEPVNEDEGAQSADEEYHNKGLHSVSSSITYIDRGDTYLDDLRIRNEKLRKYASSPANTMQKAKFEFYLPTEDSIEGETYIAEFYARNPKLKAKIDSGEGLTAAEIKTVLNFSDEHFFYPVDQIPIGIRIKDGKTVIDGGIFYHDTSYDNIAVPSYVETEAIGNPGAIDAYKKAEQEKTRTERVSALTALLKGDGYYMTGGTVQVKSVGHPNHKPWDQKNRLDSVSKVFSQPTSDISLYIGNNSGNLDNGTEKADEDGIYANVTPGGIYSSTNKTSNKKEGTVKLNYSKLTAEHADILFEAIMQRYAPGNEGGSIKPMTDPRVEGLTRGEVIDLLVRFGETATSVTNEDNAADWEDILEHKIHKQLFVDNSSKYPQLVFGENRMDLYRKKTRSTMKKKFIEWATEHKNYQVYIKNDGLGISSLDRTFDKSFKLGSIDHKGDTTYQQYVLDNEMVKTDLEEFVPGSLFEGPAIEMDTSTATIVKYNQKKVVTKPEDQQVASKKKPTPAKKPTKKEKEQQEFASETAAKVNNITIRDGEAQITSAKQLASLPPQTTIKFNAYSVKKVKGEYIDTEYLSAIGHIDANGNISIREGLKSTDRFFRLDKKSTSDPATFDLLEVAGSITPNHKIVAVIPKGHTPAVEAPTPEPTPTPKITKTPAKPKVTPDTIESLEKQLAEEKKGTPQYAVINLKIKQLKAKGAEETQQADTKDPVQPQTEEEIKKSDDEDMDDLPPLPGHDKVYRTMIPRDFEVQDLDAELQVVRNMLGKKVAGNFDMVDRLIAIPQAGSRMAFAQYKHDTITLFKGAEKGTVYHEAFHRVTLGYLNAVERERLYDAARKQYPDRLDVANNREVEEYLAERFREYVLSREHTSDKGKVKGFFRRLYEWIKTFFTGPTRLTTSNVETMFNAIYTGQYKRNNILQANIDNSLDGFDYWRLQLSSINTAAKMKKVVKGLTATLFAVNEITEVSHNLDKLDWGALQNSLRDSINTYKGYVKANKRLNGEPLREMDIQRANDTIRLYEELLGYNPKTKMNENFPAVREQMLSYMRSIGIQTKDNQEQDIYITDEGIVQHDKMSHEVSIKANAQGSIKLLIATSPKSAKRDAFTNMLEFVDYNEAWSMLLEDLAHLDNVAEMIDKMQSEKNVPNKYFYNHILDKLNQEDQTLGALFRNQFEVTINKHAHSFVNLIIEDDGNGNFDYKFSDANLSKGSRLAKETWSQNLYTSPFMIKVAGKDDVLKRKRNSKKDEETIDSLDIQLSTITKELHKVKDTSEFYGKQAMFKEYLINILNKVGISIDYQTIQEYQKINNLTDAEALVQLAKDANNIFNDILTKYKPGKKGLISNRLYDNSHLNRIADAYAKANPHMTNDMIMGPANATYYKFSNNSHVTSKTRRYNKDKVHVQDVLDSRGMGNSAFLQQMLDPTTKVDVKTYAGAYLKDSGDRGRDYFDITPLEDYIMKVNGYLQGYIPFPTLADKGTYYLLEGLKTVDTSKLVIDPESGDVMIPDEVLDVFVGYAKDEYDRIEGVRKDQKNKDKYRNKMVQNYHFVMDKNGRRNYKDANGLKYHLFPGLNTNKWEEDVVKTQIIKGLTEAINSEIAYALKIEALITAKKGDAKGRLTRGLMDGKMFAKLEGEHGSEASAAKVMVASYALKAMQSNIEIYKMYVGDPAFFKTKNDTVADDLGKRLGAMIGNGEHMVEHTDHWGSSLRESTYGVATIETQLLESKYYPDLLKMHTDALIERGEKIKGSPLTEVEIARATARAEMVLKPYLEIDQADGQSFITPEFYRSISIRIGEWSDIKEEAYKLLTSTMTLTAEEELIAMNAVMQPIKPVYYGQDSETFGDDNVLISIYDKMSMAPLFRRVVQGTQSETILDRMEAKGQFKGKQKIHMLKMDSVTKVGNRGATKLFEDPTTQNILALDNLNKIPVFKQHYRSLRRQLVTDPHDTPTRKLGSQFIKIGFANVEPNETYENGQTGEQITKTVNDGLAALSEFGNQELKKRLGFEDGRSDQRMLVNELRKEAQIANMPMAVVDAIRYDEVEDRMYLQFDSMPNRKWYQSRLISLISKYVIDRQFAGGQYIQVSNLGLKKDELRVMKTEETDLQELKFTRLAEDGTIKPMQALVSVSLFKNVIPGYKNMAWPEKVAYIRKQKLDILGYRIPTQGQNSTVAITVGGILPEQAGDAVILPAEFTALTGSDFDIDKLFLARPNYKVDRKGNLQEISYLKGNQFEAQYARMINYQWGRYRDLLGDDFNDWYYDNHMDEEEVLQAATGITDIINAEIQALVDQREALKESKPDKPVDQRREINKQLAYIDKKIHELKEDSIEYVEIEEDLKNKKRVILRERKKEELIKLGSLPTFEEFQELSEMKRNIPKAIQNKILDNYRTILTSKTNIIGSTSPLVGNLAGQELKDLADKVVAMKDRHIDKGMLSLVSLASQNEAKFRYGSGRGGVGPFALHNAHHVLTQQAKTTMPNRGISNLQHSSGGQVEFSHIYSKDGSLILDWTSALIDAHVDLPTNPYILELNVNAFTYNAVGYLVRSGVGKTTFDFLAQPAIAEASEVFLRRHGSKLLDNYNEERVLETVKRKYMRALGYYNEKTTDEQKAKIDADIANYKDKLLSFTNNNLEQAVLEGKFDENEVEYNKIQAAVVLKFEELSDEAETFNKLIKASGVDTKKYGTNLAEYRLFTKHVAEARRLGRIGALGNADKIVGTEVGAKDGDLFTTSYFEYGADMIGELFSQQTIMALPSIEGLIDIMTTAAGPNIEFDPYMINQVYDAVYTALTAKNILGNPEFFGLSRGSIMNLLFGKFRTNEETKQRELIEEDTIFQQYNRLHAKYPELHENPFFSRLAVKTETNKKVSLIKNSFTFVRTDFNDPWETESIITGWEDLVNSPNPDVSSFGKNLVIYSAITTGMQSRLHSFWNYVPPTLMKAMNMKSKTVSFDDGVVALHKKLESPMGIEESIETIDKVFRHVKDLRPDITKLNTSTVVVGEDHKVIAPSSVGVKLTSIEEGVPSFRPYVTFRNNVYKWAGYYTKKGKDIPVYRMVNKLGHFKGGRNLTEYAYGVQEGDSLLAANHVVGPFNEAKFKDFAKKHYGESFVYMSDEDIFYGGYGEVESDPISPVVDPTPSQMTDEVRDRLSTPEAPLDIFTDGSHVNKQDEKTMATWGSILTYNGKQYRLSAGPEWGAKESKKYGVRVSNPTAELAAIEKSLEVFKDTDEHIRIVADWNGVGLYGALHAISEPYEGKAEKPWKADKAYIKDYVARIESYVNQIEENGGSVTIKWVPSHAMESSDKVTKHEDVYHDANGNLDTNLVHYLSINNDLADDVARHQESFDEMSSVLDLRSPLATPKVQPNVVELPQEEQEDGAERKEDCAKQTK